MSHVHPPDTSVTVVYSFHSDIHLCVCAYVCKCIYVSEVCSRPPREGITEYVLESSMGTGTTLNTKQDAQYCWLI